jgi:hypothetical protein
MIRTRLTLVALLLVLTGTGCWYRREAYDFGRNSPVPCLRTKLARIYVGAFGHALLRECRLWMLPPFYWCRPLDGFVSTIAVQNETEQQVRVVIERYAVRARNPAVEISPTTPVISRDSPLILKTDIGRGARAAKRVRFRVPPGLGETTLLISGAVETEGNAEPYECAVPLEHESVPLMWAPGVVE